MGIRTEMGLVSLVWGQGRGLPGPRGWGGWTARECGRRAPPRPDHGGQAGACFDPSATFWDEAGGVWPPRF